MSNTNCDEPKKTSLFRIALSINMLSTEHYNLIKKVIDVIGDEFVRDFLFRLLAFGKSIESNLSIEQSNTFIDKRPFDEKIYKFQLKIINTNSLYYELDTHLKKYSQGRFRQGEICRLLYLGFEKLLDLVVKRKTIDRRTKQRVEIDTSLYVRGFEIVSKYLEGLSEAYDVFSGDINSVLIMEQKQEYNKNNQNIVPDLPLPPSITSKSQEVGSNISLLNTVKSENLIDRNSNSDLEKIVIETNANPEWDDFTFKV